MGLRNSAANGKLVVLVQEKDTAIAITEDENAERHQKVQQSRYKPHGIPFDNALSVVNKNELHDHGIGARLYDPMSA